MKINGAAEDSAAIAENCVLDKSFITYVDTMSADTNQGE
jgi:hypothetical protein